MLFCNPSTLTISQDGDVNVLKDVIFGLVRRQFVVANENEGSCTFWKGRPLLPLLQQPITTVQFECFRGKEHVHDKPFDAHTYIIT